MIPKEYIQDVLDCYFHNKSFTDQYGTVHDSTTAEAILQKWFDIPKQFLELADDNQKASIYTILFGDVK